MTDKTQDTGKIVGGKPAIARYAPMALIAVVAIVGAFALRDYISFDALRDNREALIAFRDSNFALTVLGFVFCYVLIVTFSLPGASIATLTGGFLFGTFLGAAINVSAATIGATFIFLAARMGLGDKLKARMEASDGLVAKIKKGLDENQWSMLFFIRLVPAVPFFVANLIPAFLGVPIQRFVISTFLGIIPGSLVYSSVGAGLGEVFARGETPNLGIIFEPHILLPILGLCALSLLPVVIKAVTGKKGNFEMKHIKTDILVIGAGSGGLSVAAGAAQMGANVVLLEGHKMGGDCLNYGCVPSKALIATGKAAYAQKHSVQFGVSDASGTVDYAAAKDHVHDVIATIAPVDSQERFEGFGINVIREFGRFISPTEVQAGDKIIKARRIVIATGSSPLVPPIPGLANVPYETNETLFDLREVPEHLLIIGGGPIGMEMAQAHIRMGCKVTVIEGAKALGKDDPELAEVVLSSLRDEGVEIAEDALAAEVRGKAGAIEVETKDGRVFRGSHLLMAVGRKANTDKLDLEAGGVKPSRNGITVDDNLRTNNRRVYAIGDVAGGLQFTHVAGYHAGVIIRSMLFGLPSKAKTTHIPWATYTDPELSQVGLTEAEAKKKHGSALEVVRFHYSHNDRAIAERKTKGFIKVMVVKGRPVGASIVGYQAGELINLWALALANNMKMSQIAAMVAPYPTIGEINKRAAGAYFSPRLFESDLVKRVVGFVQRYVP